MKIVDKPRASFILQYFGKIDNVSKIITHIKKCGPDIEIIVCNDSCSHVDKIQGMLNERNHYQICMRNMNEVRSYNNAIRFSHSPICIISQDDDVPPDNNKWFEESMTLFSDRSLGIVGLNEGSVNPWGQEGCQGGSKARLGLKYMHWLNFGPWFIRKSAFFECGMFSKDYSEVGEAAGGADSAMCAEMWLKDYKCVLLSNDATGQWKRHVGGRISFRDDKAKKIRTVRIDKNLEIYKKIYKDKYDMISEKVKEANSK